MNFVQAVVTATATVEAIAKPTATLDRPTRGEAVGNYDMTPPNRTTATNGVRSNQSTLLTEKMHEKYIHCMNKS